MDGNVVLVAVPVQQRSEQRTHLNGLKVSAVEDIREVKLFQRRAMVYLASYVLLNPLRAFVTVNDPSRKAETLIQ